MSSIDSYEPDPANLRLLTRTAQRSTNVRWRVHQQAVSNRDGTLRFVSGAFSESRLADASDAEAITVPVSDLHALDLDVDLIKMDIEGAEWPIITDPRLAECPARVLVMEWHNRGCAEENPHLAALTALDAAGYRVLSSRGTVGTGTVWAARPSAG